MNVYTNVCIYFAYYVYKQIHILWKNQAYTHLPSYCNIQYHTYEYIYERMHILCMLYIQTYSCTNGFLYICISTNWMLRFHSPYDSFHWKCYTPKIHQIEKFWFLSVSPSPNSNWVFGSIWICTEQFKFLDLVDFGGCSIFSGIYHDALAVVAHLSFIHVCVHIYTYIYIYMYTYL